MTPQKTRLLKTRAVQKALDCPSVQALLRLLNQEDEGLRGARVTGVDGHLTVPIDWLPDDVGTREKIRLLDQARRDLSDRGLSRDDDVRRCRICGRWDVFAS